MRAGTVTVLMLAASSLWGTAAMRADSPTADPTAIDRFIRDLASDDFDVREAASKALKEWGEAALPALHEALESRDAEVSRRARDVIEAIDGPLEEKASALVKKCKGIVASDDNYPGCINVYLDQVPTDADLRLLKYLGPVGTLRLCGCDLNDSHLKALAGFSELKDFSFFGPKVTDSGLAALEKLTQLESVGMEGSDLISDCGLEHLKELSALRTVTFGCDGFTDAGLEHLSGLKHLKRLFIAEGTRISGSGLVRLNSLPRLERLDLHGATTDEGLKPLEKCVNLRSLYLDSERVTDDGLAHLRNLGALTELSYYGSMTDAGLAHLRDLHSLQRLSLGRGTITDKVITDQGLAYLGSMKELRTVSIDSNRITDAGLAAFRDLPKLDTLSVCNAPLTDAGLAALKGHASLTLVCGNRARFTERGYLDFIRSLPKCARQVESLDESAKRAKEEAAEAAKDKRPER